METNEIIDKYFSRENLLDTVTKYELYYQIGLGHIVYSSLQDEDETIEKLKNLNLSIDTQIIFRTIYENVLHFAQQDDFDEKYDFHIRVKALSQMLSDFVKADEELLNPEPFADEIYKKILDDTLFTSEMEDQFDNDYVQLYSYWEETISQEITKSLQEAILEKE